MRYPSQLVPFKDFSRLVDIYSVCLTRIKLDDFDTDMKTRPYTSLILWYNDYVDDLYQMAFVGGNWRQFFLSYSEEKLKIFEEVFPETTRLLDKLMHKKIKSNHLMETVVKIKN